MKLNLQSILATGILAMATLSPAISNAQSDHRQSTKNTWRNLGIGSAAAGVYGLLKGDSFLTLAGAAGAAYSASRYEHDRKSQSAADRRRASIFERGYYYSHGHKYVKRSYRRHGQRYYKFVRADS